MELDRSSCGFFFGFFALNERTVPGLGTVQHFWLLPSVLASSPCLPDEELTNLNERVDRIGGSREKFSFTGISGAVIREALSEDVPRLIQKVRRVWSNLNQIPVIANAKGLLEVLELRKALERNREVEVRIVDAYTRD